MKTEWTAPFAGATVQELLNLASNYSVGLARIVLESRLRVRTDLKINSDGQLQDYDLTRVKEAIRRVIEDPPCPICASPETFKPHHDGSARCESGSIASGGTHAHCTCDTCF